MALKRSDTPYEPQGILPFEIDTTGGEADVTARAGLPLVLETMRALEVEKAIGQHLSIRKRQSGYSEAEHTEALVLLLAAGGDCLDDIQILAADKGLLSLLDKGALPSADAARQFLLAFHDEELLSEARAKMDANEKSLVAPESKALLGLGQVVEHLVRRVHKHRPAQVATMEMDATIIESHKREAEPHYKGGRGYQPAVMYWVEADLVVADQFRDGNVPAGKRPLDVIQKGFAVLPEEIEHRRFRSDSAAYEEETLKWLSAPENRIERFTVSADMSEALHKKCTAVHDAGWRPYEERANETVTYSEVEFVPGDWSKGARPLRTLVLKIQKRQGELFANGSDKKHLCVVSNDFEMDAAKLIRWHYEKAGHIEVVHDVVKNELGGRVLPCGAFGANAAWFRMSLLTYNVLSAMKTFALPPTLADARPKRLRFSVFTIPAKIVTHARKLFARLAGVIAQAIDLLAGRRALRRLLTS
jgi:hypothetical protein